MAIYEKQINGWNQGIRVKRISILKAFVIASITIGGGSLVSAQIAVNPGPLGNITSVGNATLDTTPALLEDVPEPTGLGNFVQGPNSLAQAWESPVLGHAGRERWRSGLCQLPLSCGR